MKDERVIEDEICVLLTQLDIAPISKGGYYLTMLIKKCYYEYINSHEILKVEKIGRECFGLNIKSHVRHCIERMRQQKPEFVLKILKRNTMPDRIKLNDYIYSMTDWLRTHDYDWSAFEWMPVQR